MPAVCRDEQDHGRSRDLSLAWFRVAAMCQDGLEGAASSLQAAAKKAAKLSPEEVRRMRQAKDPYFRKGGARGHADAAEADAAAMPPPASRLPPKRKKGLGFQARLPWMAPGAYAFMHTSCTPHKVRPASWRSPLCTADSSARTWDLKCHNDYSDGCEQV